MLDLDDDQLRLFVAHIEALSCAVSVMDRTGRIISVNSRCVEMMGRPRHEIEGSKVEDFYTDPVARENVRRGIENFSANRDMEFFLPLPNGLRRPVVSSACMLGDVPPLSNYRVVTMFDITAQKNAEEQVKEQYRHIVELSNTVMEQASALKTYSRDLEKRVEERTDQLRQANLDAIYMLAVAAEAKDADTGQHVRRIQHYSQRLALALGLPEDQAVEIGYSSILHDIGKIHVPDHILKKPGPLTDAERDTMRTHTVSGERIISTDGFFTIARTIARSHHENWDGSGYPDGLLKDATPLPARIVHLADVYDALTSVRPYKKAWSPAAAIKSIEEDIGRMFDPEIAHALVASYNNGDFTAAFSESHALAL